MRLYLHLALKLVFYSLFLCLISAFTSRSDSETRFDNTFNGSPWYKQQNAVVKTDRITSREIWKTYQKRSSDINKNNENAKRHPPYYLSYDSRQQNNYHAMGHKMTEQQSEISYGQGSAQQFGSNEQQIDDNLGNDYKSDSEETAESKVKQNKIEPRKVGKLGLNGTFGFFIFNRFYRCDKPKRLDRDPESPATFIIPKDIDYYEKCIYFEDDPIKKFRRKVGKLGRSGYFGYYENGVYVKCKRPDRVESDPKTPDVYYIPNDINYNPKCKYFDRNVTGIYDYIGKQNSDSGGILNQMNLSFFILLICVRIV